MNDVESILDVQFRDVLRTKTPDERCNLLLKLLRMKPLRPAEPCIGFPPGCNRFVQARGLCRREKTDSSSSWRPSAGLPVHRTRRSGCGDWRLLKLALRAFGFRCVE